MICGIIKKGSTDTVSVKAIKLRLNTLLGSDLDVQNGNFGDTTKEVVKQFQRANHLLDDGVVGGLTWERLFTVSPINRVESLSLRDRAIEVALTQLKVREKTGNNDGAEVESYLKSVGLGKGYAWCMAFVFWSFLRASSDLKVPNPVPKTAGVLDCARKAKKYLVVGAPLPGDQFVMDFGKGQGHTGLVTEVKGLYIYTVEGNTSADPSYAGEDREGNGVFERSRAISSIKAFYRYV